jgi:hypothetical protein
MATATTNLNPEQLAPLPMFTINVLVEGFPVKIEASGNADQLFGLVAKLKESGATPPAWANASTAVASPATPTAQPAPRCQVHGWEMKKSQFGENNYYCGKCNAAKKQGKAA